MKKLIILFLIILFPVTAIPQVMDLGLESIKSEELIKTVVALCSSEFDGRLPGSLGYNIAANFAADKFRQLGLIPAGEEEYFQYLNVEYNKIDTPVVFNLIINNVRYPYLLGKDFVLRGFTGAANLIAQVVFCGYGISRPDLGYDDYEKIDVKDKIVMVFKQNPSWKIKEMPWGQEFPREKSIVAKKHGARGIIFVSRPNDEKPQPLISSVMHGEGEQPEDFPQLHISSEVANDFLSLLNMSITECQTRIDEKKTPFSFLTKRKAEIIVNAQYEKSAKTMNVVGKIKGTDPELKEEYLVIGAHLDHVGSQAGLLFPGANDNASGSAAVLEIADAFQRSNIKPKRTILFILFASEEQGLNGSKHFVENWKKGYDKIAAMINLDCVGYGDSIQVGNGESAPVLWGIAKQIDETSFNSMVDRTWNGGGADATPFHEKGIPCLYFVTTNSYDHLHLPTDTPETLNKNIFEKIVMLAYLTAREVSDGNYKREAIIK